MAFNPLIPQPTDKKSVSQNDILTNFTSLNTTFDTDHVTFDAVSDNGKHKKITFQQQSGDPTTPPSATEKQLYTKDVGGFPHLFMRNSGALWDLSNVVIGADASLTMYLMGEYDNTHPLLLRSGNTVLNAIGSLASTTITYATAFPNFTVHLVLTPFKDSDVDVRLVLKSTSKTGFVVYNPTAITCDLMYFAIGR
jgi:hypothetical protein